MRLLLLEAGFLAAILGGFTLVTWWIAGAFDSGLELATAAVLMGACLLVNWHLVRSGWRRLNDDFGGGDGAP